MVGCTGDIITTQAMTLASAFVSDGGALADTLHRSSATALDDDLLEELLTPSFAAELRGRARASMGATVAGLTGSLEARLFDFDVGNIGPQKILPQTALYTDEVVPRDPYMDADLCPFLVRISMILRWGGALQREYLRRTPVGWIRNPKDGLPPALGTHARALARTWVDAYRGTTALARPFLSTLGIHPRRGLGDYASDLRTEDGRQLLGVLLETRTLDRRQIRAEAVRRLVTETLQGRSHTMVLGVLLTFELFQRQFVDGDGLEGGEVWRSAARASSSESASRGFETPL